MLRRVLLASGSLKRTRPPLLSQSHLPSTSSAFPCFRVSPFAHGPFSEGFSGRRALAAAAGSAQEEGEEEEKSRQNAEAATRLKTALSEAPKRRIQKSKASTGEPDKTENASPSDPAAASEKKDVHGAESGGGGGGGGGGSGANNAGNNGNKLRRSTSSVRINPHIVERNDALPPPNAIMALLLGVANASKMVLTLPGMLWRGTKFVTIKTFELIRRPSLAGVWYQSAKEKAKHELSHYWTGFKLFGVELRTSLRLIRKKIGGEELSRREQLQLGRTWSDIGRMGPFMLFVIIPFLEFALPIFLKLFPNMLPTPFQDPALRVQKQKYTAQVRKEMSSYLQEMVKEMGRRVKARGTPSDLATVAALVDFVEKTRRNEPISLQTILLLNQTFSDDLTLERMTRDELQLMCRYMGVTAFGNDAFLRYALMSRLKAIRADDRTLWWEGLKELNLEELKAAALERGMLAESDDLAYYRTLLARWIELSINQNVSPTMLILSRAFAVAGALTEDDDEATKSAVGVFKKFEQVEPELVQEALLQAVESDHLAATELAEKKANEAFFGHAHPHPSGSESGVGGDASHHEEDELKHQVDLEEDAKRTSLLSKAKLEALLGQNEIIEMEAAQQQQAQQQQQQQKQEPASKKS